MKRGSRSSRHLVVWCGGSNPERNYLAEEG